MPHIVIVSSSIRVGRKSHRVALYLQQYLNENNLATVEILDLMQYNFPVFEERLKFLSNPSPEVVSFAEKIKNADGIIIVTPEYNSGYPASLKNAIDLLYEEWYRKPIAMASVSAGDFGGSHVITSLMVTFFKIRAWIVPASFSVPRVQDNYDEEGNPKDKAATDKRAGGFIAELLFMINAKVK